MVEVIDLLGVTAASGLKTEDSRNTFSPSQPPEPAAEVKSEVGQETVPWSSAGGRSDDGSLRSRVKKELEEQSGVEVKKEK